MLSKNKQKFIASLNRKKIREQQGVFIAEGHKLVIDLMGSNCKLLTLITTEEWLSEHHQNIQKNTEIITCPLSDIKKITTLKSPPSVIAIFEQNKALLNIDELNSQLCLFLDEVQDPGNLGTIIRLADWFGIEHVICTKTCADIYNPKTIQATMGAIGRVKTHYVDTQTFFEDYTQLGLPIYGTFLDGNNIYQEKLSKNGLIVMGNEGQGISPSVEKFINQKLYIPSYPSDVISSESLNVSVATAITCAEFRRQFQ
ncbi:RNA methyltransferase [Carboxylicivirga sp. M1479]|uniref:TrmH family RNA methyltransferase n=1 Tax=Carboxylicivirga sp. M1479 TaxID=2594476 RepID=UPI001177594D|nr:RNA methyltransferase [Carboxylicivirga sp. M1479]TRX64326.1 RNA methyltransferase [Carboxylicivirga sp. M1479]